MASHTNSIATLACMNKLSLKFIFTDKLGSSCGNRLHFEMLLPNSISLQFGLIRTQARWMLKRGNRADVKDGLYGKEKNSLVEFGYTELIGVL